MTTNIQTHRSIDPKTMPSHFESQAVEAKWSEVWDKEGVYHYNQSVGRDKTFVVDTPPPTVSGSLHVGHVFSYTHTDVVVRYKRMKGNNIFYPMGWDDNGLPTERRVQNYYNVRCEYTASPGFYLDAKTAIETNKKDDPPRIVNRQNFIDLCLALTLEDEKAFKALWRRIGLSVDWRQEYSTIDKHSIKIAQQSFIDLYQKGHVYGIEAPTMWDVDFQTAVAQAELEDRNVAGNFHQICFAVQNEAGAIEDSFVIATTRPELLAACVGVATHPEDKRYKHLIGKTAITPVFHMPVPIFASDLVDPEKGTGILMVCTFGDATDVAWWREQKLAIRQIIGRNGRLIALDFTKEGWLSIKADLANNNYAQLSGKTIKQAQKIMVDLLRDPQNASYGEAAPLVGEPKPLEHAVKFFEKGDKPLEFITTRQWFVRLLDKKDKLVEKGNEIVWHPDHMRLRYKNWTENLQFDWCISRQRYFGVPFPVWYPIDSEGNINYDEPIVAKLESLPVDPMSAVPDNYNESQRGQKNGFIAESDVFDTWFTSSMTPQLCSNWLIEPTKHHSLFPMDLRPQSHEIIRTWAFYTIAKAMLHENKIPWKQVAISGWVLDPDRKKMSKSKGNVLTPMHLLDQYGSDAVRYWSANAKLGTDTAFDENILKIAKRLVTKIFNAGKFVLSINAKQGNISEELDKAFVSELKQTVEKASFYFERFDYSAAINEAERFFWDKFTDTYIELVKQRAYSEDSGADSQEKISAVASLRLGLSVLLRLFAPVLPYVTEEVWSWAYANDFSNKNNYMSIHKASWPSAQEFECISEPEGKDSFLIACQVQSLINKSKTEAGVSVGKEIQSLTLRAQIKTLEKFRLVQSDVFKACKVKSWNLEPDESLEENIFVVIETKFEL